MRNEEDQGQAEYPLVCDVAQVCADVEGRVENSLCLSRALTVMTPKEAPNDSVNVHHQTRLTSFEDLLDRRVILGQLHGIGCTTEEWLLQHGRQECLQRFAVVLPHWRLKMEEGLQNTLRVCEIYRTQNR